MPSSTFALGITRDALGGASVFVSAAVVRDGVGVSGVWAAVLVGSGAVVGLAANGAIMNAGGNCDYCGSPIGFYGCPKHGTDCYNPPYPDIGQPCGGFGCDGGTDLCVDCDREIDEWRNSNAQSR